MNCHFLLQEVFLTQGLSTSLLWFLHCKQIRYLLNHREVCVCVCVYSYSCASSCVCVATPVLQVASRFSCASSCKQIRYLLSHREVCVCVCVCVCSYSCASSCVCVCVCVCSYSCASSWLSDLEIYIYIFFLLCMYFTYIQSLKHHMYF